MFMKLFRRRGPQFQAHGNFVSIKNTSGTAGSTISSLVDEYQVTTDNDPTVKLVEEAMEGFALAPKLGTFLADNFPFCKLAFLSTSSRNELMISETCSRRAPGGGFKSLTRKMFEHRKNI